jgi:hypothetical protein
MKLFKTGCGVVILGVIMFLVGASLFSYRGRPFPGMMAIGEISFTFWLPVIALGAILMAVGKKNEKK